MPYIAISLRQREEHTCLSTDIICICLELFHGRFTERAFSIYPVKIKTMTCEGSWKRGERGRGERGRGRAQMTQSQRIGQISVLTYRQTHRQKWTDSEFQYYLTVNNLTTGYIQTPGWTYLTEEKPVTFPHMDSWVSVPFPSAHQAMVTTQDVHLDDPSEGDCVKQELELWVTRHFPPDSGLPARPDNLRNGTSFTVSAGNFSIVRPRLMRSTFRTSDFMTV